MHCSAVPAQEICLECCVSSSWGPKWTTFCCCVWLLQQRPAGGSSTEVRRSRNSSSSASDEPLGGYGPMSPTFKVPHLQFFPPPPVGWSALLEKKKSLSRCSDYVLTCGVLFCPIRSSWSSSTRYVPTLPAACTCVLHVKPLMHVVTRSLTGWSEQQGTSGGQVLGELRCNVWGPSTFAHSLVAEILLAMDFSPHFISFCFIDVIIKFSHRSLREPCLWERGELCDSSSSDTETCHTVALQLLLLIISWRGNLPSRDCRCQVYTKIVWSPAAFTLH